MPSFDPRPSGAALLALVLISTGCGRASTSTEGPRDARANVPALAGQGLAPGGQGLAPAHTHDTPAPDAAADRAVPASQGADQAIPATDPAIQRWFLDNGAEKDRFNDALLRAQQAVAGKNPTGCRSLDAGTRGLASALPALERLSPAGQKLASTMRVPLTSFASAAASCLAGDFAAARAALDTGVAQQADAQHEVDEILEGEL